MSLLQPDYSNYEKRFIYVDAYSEDPKGKHSKWKRIKIDDLEAFAKDAHHYNVYCTIQQFSVYKRIENEEQYAPLFFDFDSKDNLTFKNVQNDVNKLIEFFTHVHGISKTELRVFFSGNRGMHVLINPIILGIEPHSELTYIYRNLALYLKSFLDLKTLDPVVYSIRRVLRLVNSVHPTSRCYKIELAYEEVLLEETEIRKLASSPREPLYSLDEFVGLCPNESLQAFYKHFFEFYKKQTEINKLKPQKLILKSGDLPICVDSLLKNSIKKSGTRNLATMCLACYFKDQDWTEDDVFKLVYDWVQKIPKNLTSAKDSQLKASTEGCIRSIFDDRSIGKNYHFICSVMRSLETECLYDKCHIAKEADQQPEKIVELELADASDGCFVGKRLNCRVMVVGKDTSPFLSPGRIQLSCKDSGGPEMTAGSMCANCLVGSKGGTVALDLPKTATFILETINCATQQQYFLLKKLYSMNCKKAKLNILEFRNIEEVELNPSIELQKDDTSEYVVRKGYYIGHKLEVNQEYHILGYIVPDPKSQHVVHIFDEGKPSETSLSSFKMSNELKKQLSIFQVKKNQSISDKFNEIYDDLERNILHIWQRRSMFIAMDLVYHSALRFKFHGELLQRGWLEGFIIGDSGQAKSDSFIKLRNHYGLGTRISGEGSRRTGLAWTWQQTAKRWFVRFGIIPNNDKRLVCIDEAAGMSEEELEKLTDMREAGIADATGGPIPAKAYARTRIIWMSNARSGRSLRTFMFPVEAIESVFHKSEDIRRLDFAVGAVTGVVSDKVIHQNPESLPIIEHRFTSDICHNLVLWAWTRTPEEIEITKEAAEKIRDVALEFGRRYSAKIPLVEPAVQRIKIARLTVATAMRLFSTTDGNNVIVLPEHVDFIRSFLLSQYDDPISLDYLNYTVNNRLDSETIFEHALSDYTSLPQVEALTKILMTTKYWVKNDLGDMLGYDKDELQDVMKNLAKYRLIEKMKGQYRMTTAGIDFVKRFDREFQSGKITLSNKNETEDSKDFSKVSEDWYK